MMRAWMIELERHDWARLRCGCGRSAAHLPETFRVLLDASSPDEAVSFRLDGHLEEQSMIFEAAPYAVSVMLAALTDGVAGFVRGHLFNTIWHLVAGESHVTEVEAGLPDLAERCQDRTREGLWLVYHEAVSGDAETALDILEFVEFDEHRLQHFRTRLSARLDS